MLALVFFLIFGLAVLVYCIKSNTSGPGPASEKIVPRSDIPVRGLQPSQEEVRPVVQASSPAAAVAPSTGRPYPFVTDSSPVLAGFPKTIAFLDTETTGLSGRDRIVSLAVVLLNTEDLRTGQAKLSFMHRIYNPGIQCHPEAERVHGHKDWTLRHQPFFMDEAEEVSLFILKAGMICCHNAAFDLLFINREFEHAGLPYLNLRSYCTMEMYRRKYSGPASLNSLISQLGLKRSGKNHGALEDVLLTINVFLALNNVPQRIPMSTIDPADYAFQNIREIPPVPAGPMPPRRRRPKARRDLGAC